MGKSVEAVEKLEMLERMMKTNTHLSKHVDKVKETLASLRADENNLDEHDLTFINVCRHYVDEQLKWKQGHQIKRVSDE